MYYRNHIRTDGSVLVSIDKNELTTKQFDYLRTTNEVNYTTIEGNILYIIFFDWKSFSQVWSNLLSQ